VRKALRECQVTVCILPNYANKHGNLTLLTLNDMTTKDVDLLQNKAKSRKDGVYSYKGNLWVVKNNNFIAFADYFGNCYQILGYFTTSIGTVDKYKAKEKLTEWLKNLK
jgi:hypothetical protein